MYRRTSVFGLIIALLGVLVLPSAGAQDEVLVSASADATASHVVNGAIIGLQSIDTGAQVHTLASVQVEEAVRGDLEGVIFVEVPGGKSNLGHDVWVSHQPFFELGDRVQLALVPAPADEADALAEGADVYSVAHGIEGSAGLNGTVISQDQAWGDYSLHGAKFGSFPVSYLINPANSGLNSTLTISRVNAAFQEWEDDAGSDIDFTYAGTTSASPKNYSDGLNTVGWVTTSNPADSYLAQTVWVSTGSTIIGFDIAFNRDHLWAAGASSGRFDIATVALHEAGHALGLGHTTASTAEIMYPSVGSGVVKHLGAGDRSGVAFLYPSSEIVLPDGTFSEADCQNLPFTRLIANGENGTEGDDIILGTPGDDRIWGRGGDDIICGMGGNDLIVGNSGNDRISGGDGNDLIRGWDGEDILAGDDGNDEIYAGVDADRVFGGNGDDLISGQAGPDYLHGGQDDDTIHGRNGWDEIIGGPGNDDLFGNQGGDLISGLDGNDYMYGGVGTADSCQGGNGFDTADPSCETIGSVP